MGEGTKRSHFMRKRRGGAERATDRALDEVPPFKDRMIGRPRETRPGKRSSSGAFR